MSLSFGPRSAHVTWRSLSGRMVGALRLPVWRILWLFFAFEEREEDEQWDAQGCLKFDLMPATGLEMWLVICGREETFCSSTGQKCSRFKSLCVRVKPVLAKRERCPERDRERERDTDDSDSSYQEKRYPSAPSGRIAVCM